MSDFFWVIKDNKRLEEQIPMREWDDDLPLSKCKEGIVKYLGKKKPKWYREVLNHE